MALGKTRFSAHGILERWGDWPGARRRAGSWQSPGRRAGGLPCARLVGSSEL